MTLEWEQVVVHSVDPATVGQWWAEALGWVVVYSSAEFCSGANVLSHRAALETAARVPYPFVLGARDG